MKTLCGILTLIWIGIQPGSAVAGESAPPAPAREVGEFLRRASGICPQQRQTKPAPSRIHQQQNPLRADPGNLARGQVLYQKEAKPTACRLCHGILGNGNGRLAVRMEPPPRNFTCGETMQTLTDGQLFWIIKNGSQGTSMPAHQSTLTDTEVWQLILYLRNFAR